jgi:hypothetical protein
MPKLNVKASTPVAICVSATSPNATKKKAPDLPEFLTKPIH